MEQQKTKLTLAPAAVGSSLALEYLVMYTNSCPSNIRVKISLGPGIDDEGLSTDIVAALLHRIHDG